MSTWTRVYDDTQRAAIETAYVDKGTRIATIMRLAAAGELPGPDNTPLEAFPIPYASVAYIAKRAKRRREGRLETNISKLDGPDTIDNLRKRLANLADYELNRQETRAASHKDLDLKRLSEIGRVSREIAALPAAQDRRLPTKPGDRPGNNQQPTTSPVRHTPLAKQILNSTKGNSEHSEPATQPDATAGLYATA